MLNKKKQINETNPLRIATLFSGNLTADSKARTVVTLQVVAGRYDPLELFWL